MQSQQRKNTTLETSRHAGLQVRFEITKPVILTKQTVLVIIIIITIVANLCSSDFDGYPHDSIFPSWFDMESVTCSGNSNNTPDTLIKRMEECIFNSDQFHKAQVSHLLQSNFLPSILCLIRLRKHFPCFKKRKALRLSSSYTYSDLEPCRVADYKSCYTGAWQVI